MHLPVINDLVYGSKKETLSVDTYLTKKEFTINVFLPAIDPTNEQVYVSILGENLTINYEFDLESRQSFSRIIALPSDVDRKALKSEFEKRVLRLVFPRTQKAGQQSDTVIFLSFPEQDLTKEKQIDLPSVDTERPLEFIPNPFVKKGKTGAHAHDLFAEEYCKEVRQFHNLIPGFQTSPLVNLSNLANMLGLRSIWVKDESKRLRLNSFKVLGGSYAIAKTIQQKLGGESVPLDFDQLTAQKTHEKLGEMVFAAATDGNHGRGVAWAASQLGYRAIIYVHKLTSAARIRSIEQNGAQVVVVDGTYDDAVRQVNLDAQKNGWQVISDTSWEGYEDIPRWVMQGYSTMLSEAQQQLTLENVHKPTHIFVQAGVGALAAATIGFYAERFQNERPKTVVVEPDLAACLYHSIEIGDGKPHSFAGDLDTIMAGLACGDPNPLAWPILRDCTDYFIKCPDYVAAKGMRVYGLPLKGDEQVISGESGAVTLGALMFLMQWDGAKALREKLNLNESSDILLINSEGNTDPEHFRNVVWEGGEAVPTLYKNYFP